MEKQELYAVLAGCLSVIGALSTMAYSSVLGRIKRNEEQRKEDLESVWDAIDDTRDDIKKLLASVATKEDVIRSEDRLIKALRPAAAAG